MSDLVHVMRVDKTTPLAEQLEPIPAQELKERMERIWRETHCSRSNSLNKWPVPMRRRT